MDLITAGAAFIVGLISAAVGTYKFLASRITPEKAKRIYQDVKKTIADYEDAKSRDGTLNADDKIKLAEDVIATIEEIVKDLE